MQSLLRERDTFERGQIEGRIEEKIEFAKSLLRDKLPLDFISKHTELSLEEIEELKKELLNE